MYVRKQCVTILILVFASIRISIQIPLYEGSSCKLHSGAIGVCLNSERCEWLKQQLLDKTMNHSDIRRCTFSVGEFQYGRKDDIVCCADQYLGQLIHGRPQPCTDDLYFDLKCPDQATIRTTDSPVNIMTRGAKLRSVCDKYSAFASGFKPPLSIIHGQEVHPNEFPHIAALGYPNNNGDYDFDCGAGLISDQWIITAAHCVKKNRVPTIVRFGKHNLHDESEEGIDRNILVCISIRKNTIISLSHFVRI